MSAQHDGATCRPAAGARARLAYAALLALLAPAYVVGSGGAVGAEPLYRSAIGERFGVYRGHASGRAASGSTPSRSARRAPRRR